MICYKDRWWCQFYKDCKHGLDCPRALTPQIEEDADNWWKSFKIEGHAPISTFITRQYCFEEKDNKQ